MDTIEATLQHVVTKFETFGWRVHAKAIKQDGKGQWKERWVL